MQNATRLRLHRKAGSSGKCRNGNTKAMEPVQLANIDRRAISAEELDFIEFFDLSDRAA